MSSRCTFTRLSHNRDRTKAGLAAAKARGIKLGNARLAVGGLGSGITVPDPNPPRVLRCPWVRGRRLHPDHVNGLLTIDRKVAFPNATVLVNEADLAFWTSAEMAGKAPDDAKPFFEMASNAIKPYTDSGRVTTFRDGNDLLTGMRAIAAPGHTVGHSTIRLSSNGSDLLLWGDIVHNAALQLPSRVASECSI
jgi:hypothetical protein